jgi:hypothetical protein
LPLIRKILKRRSRGKVSPKISLVTQSIVKFIFENKLTIFKAIDRIKETIKYLFLPNFERAIFDNGKERILPRKNVIFNKTNILKLNSN